MEDQKTRQIDPADVDVGPPTRDRGTTELQPSTGDGQMARPTDPGEIPADQSVQEYWGDQVVREVKDMLFSGDASDTELNLFLRRCAQLRFDPMGRQIFPIKRWDAQKGREVMQIQIGINGLRTIADRTGLYGGQKGPYWTGDGQTWREVWPGDNNDLLAAKVGIIRKDFDEPLWAVARWTDYVATTKNGEPTFMWSKMGPHMLAKCAEALGIRKAFPRRTKGLYTPAEMEQADDAPQGQEHSGQETPSGQWSPSQGQINRIYAIAKDEGWDTGLIDEIIQTRYDAPSKQELSRDQYDRLCDEDLPDDDLREQWHQNGGAGDSAPDKVERGGYQISPKAAQIIDQMDEKLSALEGSELADRLQQAREYAQGWPGGSSEQGALTEMLNGHESRLPSAGSGDDSAGEFDPDSFETDDEIPF